MKHLYTFLLLFVCCAWVSCDSDKGAQNFEVKMSVSALGEEKEYTLKEFANAQEDISIVSTQPSWILADYYIDDNNQPVVIVIVEENTETVERQHQLIMKAQNGNQFYLDITQKACQYFDAVMVFTAKGESKEILLDNLSVPVVSIEGLTDWLQMEWRSEKSKHVTITADENPLSAERSAEVTVKDSQGNRTIISIQQEYFTDESDGTSDEYTDQPAL